MAGRLVPLVFFPRFTTLAGAAGGGQDFTTAGTDVSAYSTAVVTVWRGAIVGSITPAFRIWFQDSTDQQVWSLCSGSPSPGDPGENQRIVYTLSLSRRWLRARVEAGGADNVLTLWAMGSLEERLP